MNGAERKPIIPDISPPVLLSTLKLTIILTIIVKAANTPPKTIPPLPLEYEEPFLRIKFTTPSNVANIANI